MIPFYHLTHTIVWTLKEVTMNEIQIFNNPQFGEVRAVTIDNEPWFVGKDVAKVLGYAKPENALATHVDEDDSLKQGITDSLGRTQNTTIINESGLYSLVLSSKLPTAKAFRRWITSEVIPSIRKNGMYGADPEELERLRRSNAVLRDWLDLLAARKRDLVEIQYECEKIRKSRDDEKAYYMEVKANYSKWCDLVRTFDNLSQQAQADINSYIDQVQIVALTTPALDEDLSAMLDSMACELLQAKHQSSTT